MQHTFQIQCQSQYMYKQWKIEITPAKSFCIVKDINVPHLFLALALIMKRLKSIAVITPKSPGLFFQADYTVLCHIIASLWWYYSYKTMCTTEPYHPPTASQHSDWSDESWWWWWFTPLRMPISIDLIHKWLKPNRNSCRWWISLRTAWQAS